MCSCHYPRMLCHVFWSQVEYKIVCFISENRGLLSPYMLTGRTELSGTVNH